MAAYTPWGSKELDMTELPSTQSVKNLPAMHETRVPSLGQADPLEKEMATRCSNLPWKIPWTEKPGGLQSMGYRVRCDLETKLQKFYWKT